jgi:hypothetical protein
MPQTLAVMRLTPLLGGLIAYTTVGGIGHVLRVLFTRADGEVNIERPNGETST